jgi:hypothetical protein
VTAGVLRVPAPADALLDTLAAAETMDETNQRLRQRWATTALITTIIGMGAAVHSGVPILVAVWSVPATAPVVIALVRSGTAGAPMRILHFVDQFRGLVPVPLPDLGHMFAFVVFGPVFVVVGVAAVLGVTLALLLQAVVGVFVCLWAYLTPERAGRSAARPGGLLIAVSLAASGVAAVVGDVTFTWMLVPFVAACWWQWHRCASVLDDRKLGTARRLLSELRGDMPAGEKVDVTLDFRATERGGRVVARAGWSLRPNARVFRHTWLTMWLRLADGCTVATTLTDHVNRQEWWTDEQHTRTYQGYTGVEVSLLLAEKHRPASVVAANATALPSVAGLELQTVAPSGDESTVSAHFRSLTVRATAADMLDLPGAEAPLAILRWLYGGIPDASPRPA